ncbi:DUF1638 domain-containing protein [Methanohalobium sp.]|uniref:DUF1638 domain-containing protein n=1 Tax=Methanohalobium sp. TaxID=2837493 RepID=UPI0025D1089B|nr:DUF1638 domain-containing protein [Methanohalobium sp.]
MPVMGIIACRMFEDEIVHVIENDSSIDDVIIVKNKNIDGLTGKLDDIGHPYTLSSFEDMVKYLANIDNNNRYYIVVNILEFGLHVNPSDLKNEVYKKVDEVSQFLDGILVFYGLCGNVLGNIEEDFKDKTCSVRILKENNGEVVDDCIGAVLGGRNEYFKALTSSRGVGTFFLTPMWASNWKEMIKDAGFTSDPYDHEMAKFAFDYAGYKRVGKIETGLNYEKDFQDRVDEFAEAFNFDIVSFHGDLRLIENCYEKTKSDIMKC